MMASFSRSTPEGRVTTFACSAEFRGPGTSPDLIWTVGSDTTDGGVFQDLLRDEITDRTCWDNGVAAYRKLAELGCPHEEAVRLVREAVREAVAEQVGA